VCTQRIVQVEHFVVTFRPLRCAVPSDSIGTVFCTNNISCCPRIRLCSSCSSRFPARPAGGSYCSSRRSRVDCTCAPESSSKYRLSRVDVAYLTRVYSEYRIRTWSSNVAFPAARITKMRWFLIAICLFFRWQIRFNWFICLQWSIAIYT